MKITEKEFLRAVPRADRRYFDMVTRRIERHRAETASRKGRQAMKNARKIGKYVFAGVLAAAVLCGGGITAMVAMRGRDSNHIFTRSSSQSESSKVTVQSGQLNLNLTDEEWCEICTGGGYMQYDNCWYTASDTGVYHQKMYALYDDIHTPEEQANATVEQQEEWAEEWNPLIDGFYSACPHASTIWYYDKETGEDVPLCARANCLHNGNEYCEATTERYNRNALMYYDGRLYAIACTTRTEEHENNQRGVLLSYALDGTGITELATFGENPAEPLSMVIHRGYVFCAFRIYSSSEILSKYKGSGYAVFGYEIATGKTVELLRVMPKESNSEGYEDCRFLTLSAGGDMLYFTSSGAWPMTYTKGTYGISLRTGEVKQVLTDTYFTAAGKYLLYRTSAGNAPAKFHILDTESGEIQDYTGIPSGRTASDGRYIFASSYLSAQTDHAVVHVYDMQMNELGQINSDTNTDFLGIQPVGEYLYAQRNSVTDSMGSGHISPSEIPMHTMVVRSKIDDILSGSGKWEELCVLEENTGYSQLKEGA